MSVNSEKIPARRIVDAMPEAFVSNSRISKEVHRRVASGQLRKLASRLYTSNLEDPAEAVVRRNLWSIVAGYFPGAVVADRTALELLPASDGSVCLVCAQGADIELPGIVLRVRRGASPQEDDRPFMGQGLHLSSPARTYLDNLCLSRARGGRVARTLSRPELETHLERMMATAGVEGLNRVRDDARRIAPLLNRADQQETLDRGFAIYRDLPSAFHRAVFMHGLVAEVHPFADGNGRLARVMMNAELVSSNEERIVIPTVYRGNYVAALRALSAGHSAEPAVRMLAYAWRFTNALDWAGLGETTEQLRACHAFEEESSAEEKGVRLQLPVRAEGPQ